MSETVAPDRKSGGVVKPACFFNGLPAGPVVERSLE